MPSTTSILLFIFSLLLICGGLYFCFARSLLDAVSLYIYFLIYQVLLVLLCLLAGLRYSNALAADIDLTGAMLKMNLLFLIFHAGVFGGYLSLSRFPSVLGVLYPRLPNDPETQSRVLWILRLLSVGLAIFTLGVILKNGGFGNTVYAIRKGGGFSGYTYLVIPYITGVYISAAFAAWLLTDKQLPAEPKKRLQRQALLLFGVNLLCVTILGDRDLLLGPIFLFMIFWIRTRLRHPALYTCLLFLLLGLMLAGLGTARQWTYSQAVLSPPNASPRRHIQQLVPIKLFNASLSMAYLTDHPEAYADLEDYYKGILAVIPRSLWEGKPSIISYGIRIRNLLQGTYQDSSGWPVLSPVLAFINGGYPFTLLIGFCTGILLKYAMIRYADHLSNPYSLMMTLIFSIKILGGGIRPSIFSNSIQYLLPFTLICLLLYWSFRSRGFGKPAESSLTK